MEGIQHLSTAGAAEETPPTPAVARRGVSSCSWKVKSSIGRLSARSGSEADRKTGPGGAQEKREGWKVLEQTGQQNAKQICEKHARYVCRPAQCHLAAVKTIKHFRGEEDFHLRRPDATSYCGKHVLNSAEEL